MEPLHLKEKSWHYKIATMFGLRFVETYTDICRYTRAVIFGFLFSLMMLLSILVLLIGYVITGYFLFHGTFFPSQDSPIVASFVGTYASLFAVANLGIVFAVERRLHSIKSTPSKPSFIKLAYRSFKDKVCCKIEIN